MGSRSRRHYDMLAQVSLPEYNVHLLRHSCSHTAKRGGMPLIGVRELRQRTAEVLRQVREERVEYVITHQGRPTALLLPLDIEAVEAAMVEASKQSLIGGWETYARVAEQVRQSWPGEQETQPVLAGLRR